MGTGCVSKRHSSGQVLHPAAVQRATGKGSFGLERPCSLLPAFGRMQHQQDQVLHGIAHLNLWGYYVPNIIARLKGKQFAIDVSW